MSLNAMNLNFKLATSLCLALFYGCSANGGSTGAAGAGGSAGNSAHSTGGAGAAAGNNAGGTVSDYQPVSASNDGDNYTLQMGRIKMVINAAVGARITEFSFDGSNVLTGPDVDTNTAAPAHNNYGSTFWTSPQSAWSWPPVAAIDSQPYTGGVDAASNSIQLVSGTATVSNVPFTVTKKFVPVPDSGEIDVTYTLANTSTSASLTAAPWQISRVAGTGSLTFFGQGTGTYTSSGTLTLTDQDGIYWYSFVSATADSKAMSDGVGWIAHVTSDNLLLLFQYPDIQTSAFAAGEAEVEIYTGPYGDYIEVEPQGAFTTIPPNGTLQWTVRWKLRQVPSGTAISAGSADLEAFALQQRNQ